MTRPLELTTPTHGFALGSYWLAFFLGVSFLTPINQSAAVSTFLGRYGLVGWAVSMSVCGTVALAAAVLSFHLAPLDKRWPRTTRIEGAIKAERVAAGGLAFTFSLYLVALISSDLGRLPADATGATVANAVLATLTTKLLAFCYVLGGTARTIQITRELRRWTRGREDPRLADPPLADPAD